MYVAEHWSILKNYQDTFHPRSTSTPIVVRTPSSKCHFYGEIYPYNKQLNCEWADGAFFSVV